MILEQNDNKGHSHPIAYARRATNDAEKKYLPTKLEMAAIIFAVNHFEVDLLGDKITIFTDHQALVTGYLSYLKGQSRGVLSRWYFNITQFMPNLTFKYKPGKINKAADALSHAPVSMEEALNGTISQIVSGGSEKELLQNIQFQQSEDQEIRNIINFIEKKELPENTKEAQRVMNLAKKGYYVVDGVLYFESSDVSGRRRLVVTENLRDR